MDTKNIESKMIAENGLNNVESNAAPKSAYPKRVFLILGNEFCERFMFYGLDTILVLYLQNRLFYADNEATVIYHSFTSLIYFMCIFGAIISDVWLGKFKTIFSLSIVYAIGCIIVSVSAIPTITFISPRVGLFIGLVLIAVGSGGIKPCVSAFGGDQFKLPEQAAQFATFFSLFYFTINFGSIFSTALTPVLRKDVQCFGYKECYSLAFGVPAVLMIISIVLFVMGKSSYTNVKMSSKNMLVQVSKCISNAFTTKMREKHVNPRKNLLDYSIDKYGYELVSDIRRLGRILVLYLPLPLFWTLYDQKGSRWTIQAKRMNGSIGFYNLEADQMQLINPLLVLVMIPLFEAFLYPALKRIGIRTSLQRIALGGILAAVSFFMTAILEFIIDAAPEKSVHLLWQLPQYIVLTAGETMFSPTGLEFSYEEAPESMKSVVTAFWQLTIAFGNVITIVFMSGRELFESKAYEFILFGSLMVVSMFIFMLLSYFYKSSTEKDKANAAQ